MKNDVAAPNYSYIAIDLKSFYASVECMERGLDPLDTNLVVADESRTEKTICLAVSPSLKAYGIPGRARLFEVIQQVKKVNRERLSRHGLQAFSGTSSSDAALKADPSLAIGFEIAKPRMGKYIEISSQIYDVYLKYVAPEDIHVYSIDEVFIDVSSYLTAYQMTAGELAKKMILDVLQTTGITATAGVGTNLYLAKIAMDIVAKHMEADENGVRMALLDERKYRELLWGHRPLRDFWRVGRGISKRLESCGIYTMGDIARCSLGKETDYYNEDLLYDMFGVNAELLIDHAWGYEPCTMAQIKAYQPETNSFSSAQVLQHPYTTEKARLIVHEMIDLMVLDLVDKASVADQIVLDIAYDKVIPKENGKKVNYKGQFTEDRYGRSVPKPAHGTANLERHSSSSREFIAKTLELYDRIIDPQLMVRRVGVTINHVISEEEGKEKDKFEQMDLFSFLNQNKKEDAQQEEALQKEKQLQKAMLDIKKRYGKSAILKGMNLEEGATTLSRNKQIGGHSE